MPKDLTWNTTRTRGNEGDIFTENRLTEYRATRWSAMYTRAMWTFEQFRNTNDFYLLFSQFDLLVKDFPWVKLYLFPLNNPEFSRRESDKMIWLLQTVYEWYVSWSINELHAIEVGTPWAWDKGISIHIFDESWRRIEVGYLVIPGYKSIDSIKFGTSKRTQDIVDWTYVRFEDEINSIFQQALTVNYNRLWKQIAETDSLTGIPVRRTWLDRINSILISCLVSWVSPWGFILLDIDRFKSINDEFWHAWGDDALRYFSRIISWIIGEDMVFCRYWWEEFLIYVPKVTWEQLWDIWKAIHVLLNEHTFSIQWKENTITASIGISMIDVDQWVWVKDLSQVIAIREVAIARADAATYHVKNSWRNAVAEFTAWMQEKPN